MDHNPQTVGQSQASSSNQDWHGFLLVYIQRWSVDLTLFFLVAKVRLDWGLQVCLANGNSIRWYQRSGISSGRDSLLLRSVNVVIDFPKYDSLPASCPTLPNRPFWSSSLASTCSFYILRKMQTRYGLSLAGVGVVQLFLSIPHKVRSAV